MVLCRWEVPRAAVDSLTLGGGERGDEWGSPRMITSTQPREGARVGGLHQGLDLGRREGGNGGCWAREGFSAGNEREEAKKERELVFFPSLILCIIFHRRSFLSSLLLHFSLCPL